MGIIIGNTEIKHNFRQLAKPLPQIDEQSYTILHCLYRIPPKYNSKWWVNIHATSYLMDQGCSEKLDLCHAINIPLAPEKHYLKDRWDTLTFTLIFAKVPKHWNVFHFIENDGNGLNFSVLNIKRNDSGIYRVEI